MKFSSNIFDLSELITWELLLTSNLFPFINNLVKRHSILVKMLKSEIWLSLIYNSLNSFKELFSKKLKLLILLLFKESNTNFDKLAFPRGVVSAIEFLYKKSCFNSLRFAFSKADRFDIILSFKPSLWSLKFAYSKTEISLIAFFSNCKILNSGHLKFFNG